MQRKRAVIYCRVSTANRNKMARVWSSRKKSAAYMLTRVEIHYSPILTGVQSPLIHTSVPIKALIAG
jgi:hypothetical protein